LTHFRARCYDAAPGSSPHTGPGIEGRHAESEGDPVIPAQEQLRILRRGVHEIVPLEEFESKLQRSVDRNKPLVIKEGFDPTAPELHIGHTITIRKLRDFQRLGHDVVFLIGDFTGRIGDPTGRSEIRRQLGDEEIAANAKTYRDQVFKILDPDRTRVEFNSSWCDSMRFSDVLELTSHYTVARLLERDDFRKRYQEGRPISMLEFLYPLVQGYDSVQLQADVEVGGTDQTFNLLVGRDLQREYGKEPQVILTMPILPGTDGVEKMSKSLGNHIGINEPPEVIFGKTMSIPDAVLEQYLTLVSDFEESAIREMMTRIQAGENPSLIKRALGRDIVQQYHGEAAAPAAEAAFNRIFVERQAPSDVPELEVTGTTLRVFQAIVQAGFAQSNAEARRLIRHGGVSLNGTKVSDENLAVDATDLGEGVLKVGKRRFVRLRLVG
jgi:tyrosyl-tRNA synthetase